jgi:AcrR family transcriptional regulator
MAPEERRAQLVACARKAFAEQGYDRVSIADIAAETGVTPALVHHYFGSKSDLFLAVISDLADSTPKLLEPRRKLARHERIRANIEAYLDAAEENAEIYLALDGAGSAAADPRIGPLVDAGRTAGVERMLANNADVIDDTPQARAALSAFVTFAQAACVQWLRGQTTREETIALVTSTLTNLLEHAIPAAEAAGGR